LGGQNLAIFSLNTTFHGPSTIRDAAFGTLPPSLR